MEASMAKVALDSNNGEIKVNCSTTMVVEKSGRGFKSIQPAVDSIPENNLNWTCILIKAGVYRERVYIPYRKSFIYMAGEGMGITYVVADAHGPMDESATLITQGDNIIFKGISFINSYNYPRIGPQNPMKPALAAKVEGDKTGFYGCGFYGLQDTLWDVSGRHYFKHCTIVGAVDFIFGSGQSIYENCVIYVLGQNLGEEGIGYITAQGRDNPNETNGFVFKYCYIIGRGKAYLGRPWRKYARVIFYKTFMSDVIVPQGWDPYFNSGGLEYV
ncbi:probable pectinesterase 29 [Salvia hispanica]|uniref:probable pectinesterase 29 n=1 Tax=Salvia hispanica TaxID=49212 RepID=UPI002009CB97|nr:probable pectinesterase 29 [Salvia hispanica]